MVVISTKALSVISTEQSEWRDLSDTFIANRCLDFAFQASLDMTEKNFNMQAAQLLCNCHLGQGTLCHLDQGTLCHLDRAERVERSV